MVSISKRRRVLIDHIVDYAEFKDEDKLIVRLPAIAPSHPVEIEFQDLEGKLVGTLLFDYDEATIGYRYGGLMGKDFVSDSNEVVQLARKLLDHADAQHIGGDEPRLVIWRLREGEGWQQLKVKMIWLEDAGSVHVDLVDKEDNA